VTIPRATPADHLHTILEVAFASMPVVGAAAAELFNTIVTPPLQKRRDEWKEEVVNRLLALENSEAVIKGLANNEVFLTVLVQASRVAISTHQQKMRKSLSNAVINSLKQNIDEDKQLHFIWLLERMTPTHLKILDFYFPKSESLRSKSGEVIINLDQRPMDRLEDVFEEYKGTNEDFLEHIFKDLATFGLIEQIKGSEFTAQFPSLPGVDKEMVHYRFSDIGYEFWDFVHERAPSLDKP